MSNIRDYKSKIRPDSASLGGASPFNIVTKTYMLQNFTKAEIRGLYSQHTEETGVFSDDYQYVLDPGLIRNENHITVLQIRFMRKSLRGLYLLTIKNEKYPIEIKIRHDSKSVTKGLDRTARYIKSYGCNGGWLVVFDRRTKIKLDDKLFMKKENFEGKTIAIVGA